MLQTFLKGVAFGILGILSFVFGLFMASYAFGMERCEGTEPLNCYVTNKSSEIISGEQLLSLSRKENGDGGAVLFLEKEVNKPSETLPVVRHWAKSPCHYNLYWWCKNHSRAPGQDEEGRANTSRPSQPATDLNDRPQPAPPAPPSPPAQTPGAAPNNNMGGMMGGGKD